MKKPGSIEAFMKPFIGDVLSVIVKGIDNVNVNVNCKWNINEIRD